MVLMKKLTILLFSILISFNSYGNWTKLDNLSSVGFTIYIDNLTIKKHDGYVYFWEMTNFIDPKSGDEISSKGYIQVDCGVVRFKILSQIDYDEPMGRGSADAYNPSNRKWVYPPENEQKWWQVLCDYVD